MKFGRTRIYEGRINMHRIAFNALLSGQTFSGIHQQLVNGLFTPSCVTQGDCSYIFKKCLEVQESGESFKETGSFDLCRKGWG